MFEYCYVEIIKKNFKESVIKMIEKEYEWISIKVSIIKSKYNWTIGRMNRKLDCNWSYRNINWEYVRSLNQRWIYIE